ncbi:PQQ-binding-like beta-propeller repeat protein [Methanosarcina sp. DH1]|uniref:outer membrane protein assembly factor BamB family protein n=1 Tax=Methanosarcina sp. DH1 TaxID=2605695 RepID=UPI001E5FDC23|nr:PQQ-binding-like beta-propeller repeat protein [Methanosarcina sp. DH1]MCC4766570.1 PQQ-binding-like beta-propeller repeat protein [Methanosarcina sp. DH1]
MCPAIKNSLILALLLLVFSVIPVSVASATEIVLDTGHHHLGDDFKEKLNPVDPEGLIYTANFTLDPSVDIESAELILTGRSIVPGPTDEFSDKVYLNEIEIGSLNDYVPAETPDSVAVNISIPVHPSLFNPGNNSLKISAGSDANDSNYDDFEFYDLSFHLTETEPVTLEPPLKVAWTYELPWELGYEIPPEVTLAAGGVLYFAREDFGKTIIIAVDAETGVLLWSKEWDGEQGISLGYNDGVLFAVHSSNIDALDAKTGKLLWSKKYLSVSWGTPVIFGNTLFISTPDDRYMAAVDAENGALKWEYEFNRTDFETEGSSYYRLSGPVVNGNIVVFRYYASHSTYTEPIAIPEDPELEPELEKPIVKEGLIALNAHTGKATWEYVYPGEVLYFEPFLYRDLVYTTLGERDIIALSVESGEEVWKTNNGKWSNVVEAINGKLFVDFSSPGILQAETGEILNEYPGSKVSFSSSVISDKFVYSTDRNNIHVFNSSTGELIWSSSKIKGYDVSKPVLHKGKLYLISSEGTLYAFEHGEEGMFFTKGLESSALYYFPQIAIAEMLILLVILLIKVKNRALIFGSWLIALTGVIFLSLKALEPYIVGFVFGLMSAFVFLFMFIIFLIGIAFLRYGIRKGKQS